MLSSNTDYFPISLGKKSFRHHHKIPGRKDFEGGSDPHSLNFKPLKAWQEKP